MEPVVNARGVRPRAWPFAAVVIAVALWPLCHRVLVREYAIDPWKLGGFAMYASYQTSLAVVFEPTPQGLRLVDESRLDRRSQRALGEFRSRRSALGALVTPDAVAAAIHAGQPGLSRLVVVVQRLWLDAETGRIASEKVNFPYEAGRPLR